MTQFCIKPVPSGIHLYHPATLISTLGGVGYIHPAPGTWGSLLSVCMLGVLATYTTSAFFFITLIFICIFGLLAIQTYQTRTLCTDAPEIVIDEMAGIGTAILVAHIFTPFDGHFITFGILFVLFRLFDITKPGLIGWADLKIKGSLGVMLDDILAGIAAGGIYVLGIYACQRLIG